MFVKQLPNDVHSILCASVKINNYKTAVAELIYNSLDADSTSIAVRIHIEENSIQVIDNGQGIKEIDMNLIGQRNMTSKFTNLSALKFIPDKYGLLGESLSNIIEVSQFVCITSRYKDTEETWVKIFNKSKGHTLKETTKRPSKGTTVSIKGFLYNRNIQRNNVNELIELHEIKTFLEQVSLLHSNISLSLRDDAKNSIILQLHKKRDIYHTLSNIYNIEKSDFKELKVEKSQYKVIAYIGTTCKDIRMDCIFLNRKIVYTDSRLHNIINNNLNKNLKYRKKVLKTKAKDNEFEEYILDKYFPFYFMFIECPYIDYIMSDKSLEFKSWKQITMLLEKLIQFYIGNIPLKEIKPTSLKQNFNTRDQIKEIMEKILNNNPNKVEGLQMQNGVKGKISKRKRRRRNKKEKLCHSSTKKRTTVTANTDSGNTKNINILNSPINLLNCKEGNCTANNDVISQTTINRGCDKVNNNKRKEINICNENKKKDSETKNNRTAKMNSPIIKKRKIDKNQKKLMFFGNNVLSKFVNPTDSIKKKCDANAQKVQTMFHSNNKNKKLAIKETVQYENTTKKFRNYTHRKFEKSITNYSVRCSPNTHERCKHDQINFNPNCRRHQDIPTSYYPLKTTYDLIKTVMISNNKNYFPDNNNKHSENIDFNPMNKENTQMISRFTFESHRYDKHEIIKPKTMYHRNQQERFITNLSKTNYHIFNNNCKLKEIDQENRGTKYYNNKNQIDFTPEKSRISNIEEILYSTSFSKINQKIYYKKHDYVEEMNKTTSYNNNTLSIRNELVNVQKEKCSSEYRNNNNIKNQYCLSKENACSSENLVTLLQHTNYANKNIEDNLNKVVNSKNLTNQTNFQFLEEQELIFEPVNICETVLGSEDIFESEIEGNHNPNSFHLDIVHNDNVNISHYFGNIDNFIKTGDVNDIKNTTIRDEFSISIDKIDQITDPVQDNLNKYQLADKDCHKNYIATDFRDFSLKNRLRFVPKGMSPIFHNCNTKYTCDQYLDEDYYGNSVYNNFINEVHINSEIFNPLLQNIKDLGTKDNEKLQNKIHRDNAALKFDDRSLKDAIVLGQVDEKFIASIIESKNNQDKGILKFLVLFDQHAVHERIRTEQNLSDYIKNNQWKSIQIENINMMLSVDEILYMHNYKEKFNEMGLQFTILSSQEISINAVPEAILGKTRREAEKVMKAVRNLIVEEINVIKTQSGCISVYPKSIMHLVFSEACRDAIKFGDELTKNDCRELIKNLSNCKTPFQCAHGRPVMAVIIDISSEEQEYKVTFTKLKEFKSKIASKNSIGN